MRKAKGIVQSGCKVAAMLLLCCCIVAGSGCAPLFERTLDPGTATQSEQDYHEPPDTAWKMQKATEVREEYGPDGKVVAMTRTEYAMPSSLASNRFRGSDEFVEADRSYRFDSTPDGQGVEFASTTVINEGAYEAGTQAQVARTAAAIEGLVGAFDRLIQLAQQAVEQVAPLYFQLEQTKANNEAVLRSRELDQKDRELDLIELHGGGHEPPAGGE